MQQNLIPLGFTIVLIGIVVIILGSVLSAKSENVKFSFFGLIGPIPFGFANDRRLFMVTLGLFVVILIVYFILRR
jgi:uncharacterized membrane protein